MYLKQCTEYDHKTMNLSDSIHNFYIKQEETGSLGEKSAWLKNLDANRPGGFHLRC